MVIYCVPCVNYAREEERSAGSEFLLKIAENTILDSILSELEFRIIEMFGRDTGKTRNVFSGDYPSTRSNARAIFHWNELLITRDTSGRS